MSLEARAALVNHPNTIFRSNAQRNDLLNPAHTETTLIAFLSSIVQMGHIVEFTAIQSDHHDDSGLSAGPYHVGTHAFGWAADVWPLRTSKEGDYIDADDPRFAVFLSDLAAATFLHQIGLAGSADTPANRTASGPTVFPDGGADHVHIGTSF